ncbi:hypothetical protein HDU89_006223 [Geranomyces variabilis]|nr:hypothetical protein HDU89_006223 [Geranomyces variabilis]
MSTDEQAADRLASLVVSTLLTIAGAVTVSAVAGVLKIFTTTVGAVTISLIKYSSEAVKQAIQDCADVTSHAITAISPAHPSAVLLAAIAAFCFIKSELQDRPWCESLLVMFSTAGRLIVEWSRIPESDTHRFRLLMAIAAANNCYFSASPPTSSSTHPQMPNRRYTWSISGARTVAIAGKNLEVSFTPTKLSISGENLHLTEIKGGVDTKPWPKSIFQADADGGFNAWQMLSLAFILALVAYFFTKWMGKTKALSSTVEVRKEITNETRLTEANAKMAGVVEKIAKRSHLWDKKSTEIRPGSCVISKRKALWVQKLADYEVALEQLALAIAARAEELREKICRLIDQGCDLNKSVWNLDEELKEE